MGNILRLLGRRLIALPFMILGITLLVFIVLQFAPGDQATAALGENSTPEAREAYRESHGLNDPLVVQYLSFLGRLLTLNFGTTTPPESPISAMIAGAFPVTLQLTFWGGS